MKILTDLNIWVMRDAFKGLKRIPNRIDASSAPHMRRCLKAGAIAVDPADPKCLILTTVGELLLSPDSDAHAVASDAIMDRGMRAETTYLSRHPFPYATRKDPSQ